MHMCMKVKDRVNPELLQSGYLLIGQKLVTTETFYNTYTCISQKKKSIRNSVIILNKFYRIPNFSHIYLCICIHFNSDKFYFCSMHLIKNSVCWQIMQQGIIKHQTKAKLIRNQLTKHGIEYQKRIITFNYRLFLLASLDENFKLKNAKKIIVFL